MICSCLLLAASFIPLISLFIPEASAALSDEEEVGDDDDAFKPTISSCDLTGSVADVMIILRTLEEPDINSIDPPADIVGDDDDDDDDEPEIDFNPFNKGNASGNARRNMT